MIMNIPWRRSVTFHSEYPIITDEYPIYPAKDYKRNWPKACGKAFSRYKKVTGGRTSVITTAKCPGMRSIMESGWIAQTWFDFTIETDGKDFEIFYPNNLKQFCDVIDYRHPLVTQFDTDWSPLKIPTGNNHSHIFKVFIPYNFDIPKGWDLMIMPVFYDDDPVFSACPGRTDGFQSDFNVHIFWHEQKGRHTVKAGTPLCQLIPIRKTGIDITLGKSSDERTHKARKRLMHKMNKFIL